MAQYKVVGKGRQLQTLDPCNCYQNDHVDLVVEGAGISLRRLSSLSVPAEVSAYIPRVEIRRRHYENGQLVCEDERIYNSITVVHAPRHPLENPPKPPALDLSPLPQEGGNPLDPAAGGQHSVPQPPLPGQPPPPPTASTAPGLEHPGAVPPPVIPSQPEPHPPPVSPGENKIPFPRRLHRQTERGNPPVITINKRPIG
ncbi:hypothetical protein SAMN02745133_02587 [Desulforamulus putei DSM 12395]|uniref:Uncharacterized protein n=1 Tax=Desulforamulus putei DSM 12395 TaxID=1121429 RepID=A0A1M5BFW4_9FIRM|nr:hypothetical protein [Desulforamulus putei]SHF41401.1 hypothetical protein SAMN02745133_02587 [Desulforamulus putei DSM 12395]